MLKKSAVNVYSLDVEKIIKEELPNLSWFYNNNDSLHADVHWLLGEFIDNRKNLPIIEIDGAAGEMLMHDAYQHYRMMMAGLKKFFKEDDATITRFMECSTTKLPQFGTFIKYARASFNANDRAIFGRYDLALDKNGRMVGAYEFNGDTPVMLFESVNLQNLISNDIYESHAQLNNWWHDTQEAFGNIKGKTVAVACELSAVEDLSTCETIVQVMEAVGAKPYLCVVTELNHDLLHLEKPFEITNVHERPDIVFILLPWEEMLESGFDILANWESWHNNVKFLEPAWRWFMSNKGFMAYLTYLLENDATFKDEWSHVKHIPSYLDSNGMSEYVRKPKIGRLGQNVRMVRGETESGTDGMYDDETCVYQAIVPTVGMPEISDDGDSRSLLGTAWVANGGISTIAFRVFGGEVTNYNDEQWIAHRVVYN